MFALLLHLYLLLLIVISLDYYYMNYSAKTNKFVHHYMILFFLKIQKNSAKNQLLYVIEHALYI